MRVNCAGCIPDIRICCGASGAPPRCFRSRHGAGLLLRVPRPLRGLLLYLRKRPAPCLLLRVGVRIGMHFPCLSHSPEWGMGKVQCLIENPGTANCVLTMPDTMQIASALRIGIASILLVVTSASFGQNEESALRMVKALRLGENLPSMTYRFAKITTTYKGIETTLGPQKADELLKAEIATAAPKYQEQWNRNLAQAWAPLMTSTEFDSVVADKQQSPFAGKFVSLQDKAGANMKQNSEPLLKAVLTEVLTGAFEKSTQRK